MVDRNRQLHRRETLAGGLAASAALAFRPAQAAISLNADATSAGMWPIYRDRFVRPEGRVIDTFHKGVSHSESQGWGMLLAGAARDWTTFDRIWSWTQATLAWRGAALFAWRWSPETGAVSDPNNASDGDILIAWALARAADARGDRTLAASAATTAEAVRRLLFAQSTRGLLLLPGMTGFVGADRRIVNLSYYVFPAMGRLAALDDQAAWSSLYQSGRALAAAARFGPDRLAPDWLAVRDDGGVAPADKWPARFGFDAIRVPLYLYWAGLDGDADLGPYRAIWSAGGREPAWRALDGGADAKQGASAGARAVRELIGEGAARSDTLWRAVKEGDYYAASLAMLAILAQEERRAR